MQQKICKDCGINECLFERSRCRDCYNLYLRTMRKRNPKPQLTPEQKEARNKRQRIYTAEWQKRNKEKHLESCRRSYRKRKKEIRDKVFEMYGGPRCNCCGLDSDVRFLCIDHVQNDGGEHRKEIHQSKLYKWLIKQPIDRERFQVLCHSCNQAKQINGGVCPHREVENGQG